ncbi:MAG: hypothetical protein SFU56_10800 [Capsulimonadales bacterium]|nr:hypothetical protein [Capsulimonadales bacterium]
MSIPNRIWNIGKAYLNQVRDRIDDALAEKELDMATSEAGKPPMDDASPDAIMERAQLRIDAARRELEARQGRAPVEEPLLDNSSASTTSANKTPHTLPEQDPNARDYKILGLPVGSDLAAVVTKYEELVNRCDPRRFPDGSDDQETAKVILARVNSAYDALRKRLDPTENRFAKLELE